MPGRSSSRRAAASAWERCAVAVGMLAVSGRLTDSSAGGRAGCLGATGATGRATVAATDSDLVDRTWPADRPQQADRLRPVDRTWQDHG